MSTSDDDFLNELNDLIDTALDSVLEMILDRRSEVMSYNSKGVPLGLVKGNSVSVEEIQAAIRQFKEQNRI